MPTETPPTAKIDTLPALRERLRALNREAALLLELQSLRQLLPLPSEVDRGLSHLASLQLARTLADLCTPAARAVFVRRTDSEAEAALCAAVLTHLPRLVPTTPTGLRPGMTVSQLTAWAHAHGVGHWLSAPAAAALVEAETSAALPAWALRGQSVVELACPLLTRRGMTSAQVAAAAQHAALSWLAKRADAAKLGQQTHAARAIGRLPPADPALAGIHEAIEGARASLAGTLAPRPHDEVRDARVKVLTNPPGLSWRLGKRVGSHCCAGPEVRLERDKSGSFALHCSCGQHTDGRQPLGVCEARLEAVERFADLVMRPAKGPNKRRLQRLAEALGAPPWRRELDQFFDAAGLENKLPKTLSGQPARFVWRLQVMGGRVGDIGPAMAAPAAPSAKRQGLQLRTLSLRAATSAADELPSDLDRAVLGLIGVARALMKRRDPEAADLWRNVAERLVGAGHVVCDDGPTAPAQVQRQRVGVALARDGDSCALQATLNGVPLRGADAHGRGATRYEAVSSTTTGLLEVLVEDGGLFWDRAAHTLVILDASRRARRALQAMDDQGGRFPLEAMPALRQRLAAVPDAGFAISASAKGAQLGTDARPRLLLALRPGRDGSQGLRVEVVVRPLAEGTTAIPGVGTKVTFAMRDGGPVHGLRDLPAERSGAMALWRGLQLPAADPADVDGAPDAHINPWAWLEEDADRALDLIARISALVAAEQAHQTAPASSQGERTPSPIAPAEVRWQSEPERVVGRANTQALRVELIDKRDWFGLSGSVGDGEGGEDETTVPLQALLAALRAGRRYVAVRPGDWLEISEEIRRQLMPVAVASDDGRLSPLAIPTLHALEDAGAHVAGPARWMRLHEKLRAAADIQPRVPDALQATLRPYQEAGFAWLMRLTTWAPGAVLADDMGLGKTVQALTLLLARADAGPSLVVMPTSVLDNWHREASRFAPRLQLRTFRSKDHHHVLDDLRAEHLVLTTWELLTRHRDKLTGQKWSTVVLDEAQAIKNPATRRAKAAFALDAGFRLALTGTPVENRTDELWSVLRAAVPGLLGGRRDFRARFAVPIERYGDPRVKATLAALIRPFVLRRMKADVAKELPPRQDIRLDVSLDAGTRQTYDALRMSLQASLRRPGQGKAGRSERAGRRIEVLAALTRLRQLACHPRLLDPQSKAPAAKVLALRGQLAELRAGGHQALVFSQFTSLLDLVRQDLEGDGLRVLQLDGRTPGGRRQTLVDTFQRGEADVFLLSVKAGGTGLNLTAASYVFHLDPWWNPAVEDQATDRAHRIGQTKPVTVYRIIARGTVEEAIYALHRDKRDLVNALLTGTGDARSLTVQELEALVVYSGKRTWDPQQPAHVRALEGGSTAPTD